MTLRLKLLIYSVIMALIPLGIAGQSMIQITRDELKSSANDSLLTAASQITQDIDDFYVHNWLTPLKIIQKAVENPNLGVNEKLSLLTSGMRTVSDIVALQITVEGAASPLLVTNSEFSSKVESAALDPLKLLEVKEERIERLLEGKERFAGDLVYLQEVDSWLISLILPLDEESFGRRATMTARIDLKGVRGRLESHPFAKSGFITLIDREGRRVFDKGREDLSANALVAVAKNLLLSDSRTIGVEPYTRPDGKKMLGAYSIPQTLDFGIVVEKNEEEAYLAVTHMVRNLLLWALAGLSIAAIGAIAGSITLTHPIRHLMEAARKISEGDLSTSIDTPNKKDEIGQLSTAFNKMAVDLQDYITRLTETTKAKERAESELKLAKKIQETFLPKEFTQWEKIEIGGRCATAREVGGDYFDFFRIDEDNYGIVIGDVSGKGIPAALFMAVSRTLFRMLSKTTFSPGKVLTDFNNRLVEMDQGTNMFITIFYGIFNDKTHKLTYSNSGHNLPYITVGRGEEAKFEMLPHMKTMIAGIMGDIEMGEAEAYLRRSGDAIILYTDGMTEAFDKNDEEFGEERLEELIRKYNDLPAQELCDKLVEEVQQYQEGMPQFDDMTLLVLKVK